MFSRILNSLFFRKRKVFFELSNEVTRIKESLEDDYVECETCGCLLRIRTAYEGEPTVRIITDRFVDRYMIVRRKNRYDITRHFYCKIHKPTIKFYENQGTV